tara:strand:+ start:3024 stop:3905 length:882 start_codon:yes stop_codon:yes gene_type:complete
MKAGTTSLAAALAAHPDVFACPIKEPNHFCRELHEAKIAFKAPNLKHFDLRQYLQQSPLPERHFAYVENRADYKALFKAYSGQKWMLDASTTYLTSPYAAAEIARAQPKAKILVVTRDPAVRAWSEFIMNVYIGVSDRDYCAALEREAAALRIGQVPLFERYVSASLYDPQIERFKWCFGEQNVLVAEFTDLVHNPDAVLDRIYQFLEIRSPEQKELPKLNGRQSPRSTIINSFLYKTGLKNLGGQILPKGIANIIRGIMYDARSEKMPDKFKDTFYQYYAEADLRAKPSTSS